MLSVIRNDHCYEATNRPVVGVIAITKDFFLKDYYEWVSTHILYVGDIRVESRPRNTRTIYQYWYQGAARDGAATLRTCCWGSSNEHRGRARGERGGTDNGRTDQSCRIQQSRRAPMLGNQPI